MGPKFLSVLLLLVFVIASLTPSSVDARSVRAKRDRRRAAVPYDPVEEFGGEDGGEVEVEDPVHDKLRLIRSPLRNEEGDTIEEEDASRDLADYEDPDASSTTKKPNSTSTTSTTAKPTSPVPVAPPQPTTKAPAPAPPPNAPPSPSAGAPSEKPRSGPPVRPGPPPGGPPPRPGPPGTNSSRPGPPSGGPPRRGPPPGFPGGLPPNLPGLPPGLFGPPPKPTPKPPPAKAGELYLPEHYNKLEIPKLNVGKPIGLEIYSQVPVFMYLNIRSVRELDEENEEITIEMDIVVEWVDGILFDKVDLAKGPPKAKNGTKLKPPPPAKTLNPLFLTKIWSPDIYIDNLVDVTSPKLLTRPRRLKFNQENGFISYYSRVSAKVKCDMDFYYYPADTQVCEFILKSYSYFDSDLSLMWVRQGVYLQNPTDANFDLAAGDIQTLKLIQDFDNHKNESHDALKFTISARRKLSYHLVQTYIPSVFFVVITWLCFMIPPKMVEARIAMAMTTLLTMTAMFASVRESTPIVSYVKAIDIWMVACIFFIFLMLLEFAVLVWFQGAPDDDHDKDEDPEDKPRKPRANGAAKPEQPTSEKVGHFIEKYAFIIYSIVFIIFAILYWTWLIKSAEYLEWKVNGTHNNLDAIDD